MHALRAATSAFPAYSKNYMLRSMYILRSIHIYFVYIWPDYGRNKSAFPAYSKKLHMPTTDKSGVVYLVPGINQKASLWVTLCYHNDINRLLIERLFKRWGAAENFGAILTHTLAFMFFFFPIWGPKGSWPFQSRTPLLGTNCLELA